MGDFKSCFNLIFTDQPNLIIESGVSSSLHDQCHHQIVYGKLSVSNIALRPYTRKIWIYDKADLLAIRSNLAVTKAKSHAYSIFQLESSASSVQ